VWLHISQPMVLADFKLHPDFKTCGWRRNFLAKGLFFIHSFDKIPNLIKPAFYQNV